MNFLAHFYLSGNSEERMIGNFLADFVRGKQFEQYSEGIIQGIMLHRKIDSYTDAHPVFKQSVARLRGKYAKYAGVIMDVFYDHLLAINWERYATSNLKDYTQYIHQLLEQNSQHLTSDARLFLKYMQHHNVPYFYAQKEGIQKVLHGMSQRTSFPSKMHEAVEELELYFPLFEDEFHVFFMDIKAYVESINYNNI
jgi:acyl carrier protein phosphodiesterase